VPRGARVEVVLEGEQGRADGQSSAIDLTREEDGYFSGWAREAAVNTRYRFRLDNKSELYPDPVSRFQPEGPHGPSVVVDPTRYEWHDGSWRGITLEGQVVYEMHVGTFAPDGTWLSASRELEELRALGISLIEVMPISEFAGRFGWGYDGVDLFAPTHLYGEPDDLRRFVDIAHGLGLGVILDVVYNHFGPDGNYLKHFSPDYFTDRYHTDWGEAFNFEGAEAAPVREFIIGNAGYWIDEFHFDGLRLDATQNIYDRSAEHILAAVTRKVRQAGAGRATIVVAENEPQHAKLARPADQGGYGIDGLWNDDFHHAAMVALTGHNEAYYTDYLGRPQELISAIKWGYLYQGQHYKWQKQRRGTPSFGLKPATFIHYFQNHDQIANSGTGRRIHDLSHPGCYRAMTALLLLGPQTPMLFQGQEFAASSPFKFFADHHPELAATVRQGRREFMSQFPSAASPEAQERLPDPADRATFEACILDFSERIKHAPVYRLHRDLLKLRKEDAVFSAQRPGCVDGAVLNAQAFVLRFFGSGHDDRLLLVNLGIDLHLNPAPEPLLAPPEGEIWTLLWSSEDFSYDGAGSKVTENEENWLIPGRAAFALKPKKNRRIGND
jgi:maltooligosyltrehalose trehalohydrolase